MSFRAPGTKQPASSAPQNAASPTNDPKLRIMRESRTKALPLSWSASVDIGSVISRSQVRGFWGTHFSGRTRFHGTLAPPPKSESLASKTSHHSGITLALKNTFEVFTWVGPDNSLERLTERSVGLVTDQPSDVYELFVTLL